MFLAESDITLVQRINRHPTLKTRIELLVNIIEDSAGDCQQANEAELRVIEELRQMGSEALRCWAEHKEGQASEDFVQAHSTAVKSGKKNSGGIPPSVRKLLMSKSLELPGSGFAPLAVGRKFIAEAAQAPCSGLSLILERIMRLA